MTYYSDKDYGILHDHMKAIARERDYANYRIEQITAQLDEAIKNLEIAKDELYLAHEAMRRAFPENQP
jgi:hypothetical protein